jgi:phosphoribosylformylglycinamidine synthase
MSTITPELVAQHQITPEEYGQIVRALGREPNITELGIFCVMWSEHCSYKSSRLLLKKLPTGGRHVLQGPGENAGIIDIGEGWACAFKIESHNHPSFVEPFQGAATGVGGILRDIFTMGARPIAVMDSLRFGPIDSGSKVQGPRSKVAAQTDVGSATAARNRRILKGVVEGIAHYGNCFGVPTVGGETVFEPCYSSNPLVNVFALGVAPADKLFFARAGGPGNPVIYVGAKTGRDGIHGASLLASAEFTEESKQKRPNVQVGDPFLEKLLLEACLEAMQTGAIVGIQDMGAAGLTCSTCEMGGRAGTGIEIELDRVPQRETGMSPYEIMLSESQERMLLVAERGREQEVFPVFRKWGLDAVTIGTVTGDGRLRVRQHGEVVADIPNSALTDEAPEYARPQKPATRLAPLEPPPGVRFQVSGVREEAEGARLTPDTWHLTPDLKALLASPTVASKRWIWEQYDYMVRTNTVVGPGSDAAVLRLKETGRWLAMTLDGNGRYAWLEPRLGARLAVAEACRNVSCTGALPVAATNCLNFGNPEKPEIMWQFAETIEGMAEACRAFQTPITGGNVSFYNETLGGAVYPTPVIGIVGLLEPDAEPVPSRFPAAGLRVAVLGGLPDAGVNDALVCFGSSEYARSVCGRVWGLPPALDLDYEVRVQTCCRELARQRIIHSAHDVSDGGLAVALAEAAFGGVGIEANIDSPLGPRLALFSEYASAIVVTVPDNQLAALQSTAAKYNVRFAAIGATRLQSFSISVNGSGVIDCPVEELRGVWEQALDEKLK